MATMGHSKISHHGYRWAINLNQSKVEDPLSPVEFVKDSLRGTMTKPFYLEPILNSPYLAPTHHHALDDEGQPLDLPPIEGRRASKYLVPVPRGKRSKASAAQRVFDLDDAGREAGKYSPNALVNELRSHLESWRRLPNPADWGVTPTTQRLLQHWRQHEFSNQRPFFCQVEAAETIIWLTAAKPRKHLSFRVAVRPH